MASSSKPPSPSSPPLSPSPPSPSHSPDFSSLVLKGLMEGREITLQSPAVRWNEGTPLRDFNHLTVVETIHHQRANKSPVTLTTSYDIPLDTGEQAYSRELTVGPEWQVLDTGWLKLWSLVVVKNHLPRIARTTPGAPPPIPQSRVSDPRTIQLGLRGKKGEFPTEVLLLIPPGQDTRLYPVSAGRWMLRCPTDTECTVTVFPS